jgi:hypothetical protein
MTNLISFENNDAVNVNGTSLKGCVITTYDDLVEKFGEPTYTWATGDKTTAEWNLEFEVDENGDTEYVTATIYDWKTCSTPMGEYEWHVGGYNMDALYVIEKALGAEVSLRMTTPTKYETVY